MGTDARVTGPGSSNGERGTQGGGNFSSYLQFERGVLRQGRGVASKKGGLGGVRA